MEEIETLTKEENAILGQTAAGTPMGEYLRRFWWPIGFSADLREKPTFVRLLSEDLVLYRDKTGTLGLLGALCAHRRANLCLGSVTGNGLRCRYHGWIYDKHGDVLQVPGDNQRARTVKQKAYPVEELGGLIFAYMGPQPVPLLPRLHYLVAPGNRRFHIQAFNDSNWVQHAENGIDPIHPSYLHADVWPRFHSLPKHLLSYPVDWGVQLQLITRGRKKGEWHYSEHPIAMPGIIFGGDTGISYNRDVQQGGHYPPGTARWSVPIDDTHTMNIRYYYKPEGHSFSDHEERNVIGKAAPVEPYLEYRSDSEELGYQLPSFIAEQDATVLDSLGPLADRENENLTNGDLAIALYRRMLLDQVKLVQEGKDPIGVIRDPAQNEVIIRAGVYDWIDDARVEEIVSSQRSLDLDGGTVQELENA